MRGRCCKRASARLNGRANPGSISTYTARPGWEPAATINGIVFSASECGDGLIPEE